MVIFNISGGLIGGLVNRWEFKTIEKNKFIISIVFSLCFLLLLFSLLSTSYFSISIISLIILLTSLIFYIFYLIFRKLPWRYRLLLVLPLTFQGLNLIYHRDNVTFIFILLILAAVLFYIIRKVQNKKDKHEDKIIDETKMRMISLLGLTQKKILMMFHKVSKRVL